MKHVREIPSGNQACLSRKSFVNGGLYLGNSSRNGGFSSMPWLITGKYVNVWSARWGQNMFSLPVSIWDGQAVGHHYSDILWRLVCSLFLLLSTSVPVISSTLRYCNTFYIHQDLGRHSFRLLGGHPFRFWCCIPSLVQLVEPTKNRKAGIRTESFFVADVSIGELYLWLNLRNAGHSWTIYLIFTYIYCTLNLL